MCNWAIYSINEKKYSEDDESSIPMCELLIPMFLSLLLCFIHSQIVATTVANTSHASKNHQKISLNSKAKIDKTKRRKKVFR